MNQLKLCANNLYSFYTLSVYNEHYMRNLYIYIYVNIFCLHFFSTDNNLCSFYTLSVYNQDIMRNLCIYEYILALEELGSLLRHQSISCLRAIKHQLKMLLHFMKRYSTWKFCTQKQFCTHSAVMYGGFQGGPQLGPHNAERR